MGQTTLEIELARFGEVVRDLLLVKLLANVEEPEQILKRYRTLQLGLIEVDKKRRDNRRMCVCVCAAGRVSPVTAGPDVAVRDTRDEPD